MTNVVNVGNQVIVKNVVVEVDAVDKKPKTLLLYLTLQ